MQKVSGTNLIEQFYDHLDEHDWLDGVDLYQAGRVAELTHFHGLISAHVQAVTSPPAEVRIKIHPAGHCIQWIECTCRKNRVSGVYCEHIAAAMIHVDREQPQMFRGLDSKMPLKPPATTRRRKVQRERDPADALEKGEGAAQTILQHLKGNIHSVALLNKGPTMRVRIEIKSGQLTHYDLNVDQAAQFIESHPNLPQASKEVGSLAVFDEYVEVGTRIYQVENETIGAELVVAIALSKKPTEKQMEKLYSGVELGKYVRVSRQNGEAKELQWMVTIPIKSAQKNLGDKYFFFQGRGYYPAFKEQLTAGFAELPLTKKFKDDEAVQFSKASFAPYLAAGPIFVEEGLQQPIIVESPSLSEIRIVDQGDGWFTLDPRYGKGKSSISMAELMKHFKERKRKYIRTGKSWLKIPDFITEYDWQLDETESMVKVDALGLLRMKAAFGDFDHFAGSKKMLNTIRNQLEFSPETAPPVVRGTKLDLRSYQHDGLKWFWWLYQNNLHGLLADEMGLGKTHQAMAIASLIQQEVEGAKFLVICPTTVLDHWLDKIMDFAPNLKPMKYHGTRRTLMLSKLQRDQHTVITSYGVLLRDIKALTEREWSAVILDEAHFVKNNDTATYKAVCKLKSRMRICLTGTPMENHLGELKNIFDFLVPGYLGSDEYFKKQFLSPIESGGEPQTELALQRLIHPFKLRRTKELVLHDLPEKVEDLRHCTLSDEQVKLYRNVIAMKAQPLVEQLQNEESPIPYLHVFATLTMLKQICNHPALLKGNNDYHKHESGKFELVKELIEEAIGSNHKIVIYSQYVEMIKIISSHLNETGVQHVILTGQTRNRGAVIKKFQEDESIKVFIGSLLAGGIGIDLTAASVVIHYDRWWNASKENQATDRVHRIGQNKNVQVLKLICRGTLEEKIDRMIAGKKALFERFLDRDEEIFKTLSRHELIDLLQ